jgi:DNA-binding transcriptional MocR family regulator
MHNRPFVSADEIRARFSAARSEMYRQEVPQYGTLVDPGRAFYPCDPDPHTMRLSFPAPGVDDILEGVSRLTCGFDAALAAGVQHDL